MASHSTLALAVLMLTCACNGKTKKEATPPDPGGGGGDGGGGGGGGGEGEAVSCEPGRCLEDISKAISERRPDARACYDEGRKRDKTIEGKIIINFAIDSEGAVGETSQGMQDNQITEQGVVDCVSEVIKTVRFAKSPKGKTTRAYHRFEFAPK